MTERSETTYTFTCDAADCKASVRENINEPRGTWLTVETRVGWDQKKKRHYCSEHAEPILVVLGLSKAKPKTETPCDSDNESAGTAVNPL